MDRGKSKGKRGKIRSNKAKIDIRWPVLWRRVRSDEPVYPPTGQYVGDVGFDLCASRPVHCYSHTLSQVPTNLAVALPPGVWAMLVGRSSTFYKHMLMVSFGVIDSGYRGEIMAMVYNFGEKRKVIQAGDRLFQLILASNLSAAHDWVQSNELPMSERGERGFGSSDPIAAIPPHIAPAVPSTIPVVGRSAPIPATAEPTGDGTHSTLIDSIDIPPEPNNT